MQHDAACARSGTVHVRRVASATAMLAAPQAARASTATVTSACWRAQLTAAHGSHCPRAGERTTSRPAPNQEPATEPAHRRAARYAWALPARPHLRGFPTAVSPLRRRNAHHRSFIADAPMCARSVLLLSVHRPASCARRVIAPHDRHLDCLLVIRAARVRGRSLRAADSSADRGVSPTAIAG